MTTTEIPVQKLGEFLKDVSVHEGRCFEGAFADELKWVTRGKYKHWAGVFDAYPVQSLFFAETELFLRFSRLIASYQRNFVVLVCDALEKAGVDSLSLQVRWGVRAQRVITISRDISGHILFISFAR
jgi:hypothetical protein